MSEQPAEYHAATPPLLRPLSEAEHRQVIISTYKLENAQAEVRLLTVAVEVLTGRALKAEAALEVERAKTALLWPVATKQTPSYDSE